MMKSSVLDEISMLGLSNMVKTRSKEFKAMADMLPQICYLSKTSGENLWYNERWSEYCGIRREWNRNQWSELCHPDDIADMVKAWDEASMKKKPFEARYRLKNKNGQYRWFLGQATPIFDHEKNVAGYLGTLTDIENLSQLQDENSEIIENMHDGCLVLDKNWHITKTNARHLNLVGKTRDQELGNHFLDTYFPDEAQKKLDYYLFYLRAMYKREASSFVDYYPPLDVWTLVNVYPKSDGGITIFYRDVSVDKRKEAELQRAQKAYELATTEKNIFVTQVSHKIRGPLASIIGYAELLAGDALSEEERKTLAHLILANCSDISGLIGELLGQKPLPSFQHSICDT